jgi:YidC/Oxa1 family membrane protein insertase
MEENRNVILAIVLSGLVLLLWQIFYAEPQMKQERLQRQLAAEQVEKAKAQAPTTAVPPAGAPAAAPQPGEAPMPASAPAAVPGAPVVPGSLQGAGVSREAVLQAAPRVAIDTPSLSGSISLRGSRIDDLVLRRYHEQVSNDSPEVVFFSPSGSEHPFYAELGWTAAPGSGVKAPDGNTQWQVEGASKLTPSTPLTLVWNNGEGLIFRRAISIDGGYMFAVKDSVENRSAKPVTLYPYALISRHEQPHTQGYYVLHEGLVGVLGEEGLQEYTYKKMLDEKAKSFRGKSGWLGITDKYWGAAIIPDQSLDYEAHFSASDNGAQKRFQADYLLGGTTIAPGGSGEVSSHLFAGAKQVGVVEGYGNALGIKQFDLLIDWGWFWFFTKPMFKALHFFYGVVGNFGVAILIVTLLLKGIFYPLANKSYESMSKMKKLQPEMERVRKRFAEDKVKQQQEMMALYQKEKVNPLSGCLPMVLQIPVFFALYKVLFVTIEMRHAPFFGWIQDLSAPDPTSMFNLFGLLPYSVPVWLGIGVWPLIMGITMWVQMKLNPQQGDPTQQAIFNWMPVMFTFMLASFPAGLVIYWAWNNLLSLLQQWWIMKKNGVDVDLLENTGIRKLLAAGAARKGR